MAVVGILVVALYGGMTSALFSTRLARENLRASAIIRGKMECIRLFTWDQVLDPTYVPTNFTETFCEPGNEPLGITYTGTVSIAAMGPTDRNYSNDMRVVTVTLNWLSGGLPRTRTLDTYVARYGMQNYIIQP